MSLLAVQACNRGELSEGLRIRCD